MLPVEIIKLEVDDQVGLYDGENESSGTGIVSDLSLKGCNERFYCGFSKDYEIDNQNKKSKALSKIEWREIANNIISKLSLLECSFEIAFVDHNGFTLEER